MSESRRDGGLKRCDETAIGRRTRRDNHCATRVGETRRDLGKAFRTPLLDRSSSADVDADE